MSVVRQDDRQRAMLLSTRVRENATLSEPPQLSSQSDPYRINPSFLLLSAVRYHHESPTHHFDQDVHLHTTDTATTNPVKQGSGHAVETAKGKSVEGVSSADGKLCRVLQDAYDQHALELQGSEAGAQRLLACIVSVQLPHWSKMEEETMLTD
ncbi:hypothetical protein PHSY_000383 [Pseudozyma hubeiensis SY62]|uniref:Uncharacterized protein n=1 Tax=Pseudozyma hubeiensis (strain SY62) TaxID=1305764 RepID=R9NWJ4_PSEHS|nr:hypothetical protein PHSY_000383 [Pseudozyma hubeiensis SY62]GAC92827.1 hypothetical protein PHSY_000383 [Pseudozyma hubeiensis SY62]